MSQKVINVQFIELTFVSRYQCLKVQAVSVIHDAMCRRGVHEASRHHIGPLTLLACLHWYLRVLFTSVSHLRNDQRKFFNAVCGMDHHSHNPYESGQLAFTMANIWSHRGDCPTVQLEVALSQQELREYLHVPNQTVLSNLISGHDRSFRPGGPRVAFPAMDWLLLHVPAISRPLSTHLSDNRGRQTPFDGVDDILAGRSIEEVVEIIFVTMARAVWNKAPSHRIEGKDVPNLANGIKEEDVKRSWGVPQFRERPQTVARFFRKAIILDNNNIKANNQWEKISSLLFGNMRSSWISNPTGQKIQELGHYMKWQELMTTLQSDLPLQRETYLLMMAKLMTLSVFPKLKASGHWMTKTQDGFVHVQLLRNPQSVSITEEMLHRAGYLVP